MKSSLEITILNLQPTVTVHMGSDSTPFGERGSENQHENTVGERGCEGQRENHTKREAHTERLVLRKTHRERLVLRKTHRGRLVLRDAMVNTEREATRGREAERERQLERGASRPYTRNQAC